MAKLDLAAALSKPAAAEPESDYDSDLEAAAQELIDAVKSGDAVAAAAALRSAHAICSNAETEEE
jgi:hypothetical protein